MKKRFLSILLTLVMVIGMLPVASLTAHAEGSGDDCYIMINGTKIDDLNVAASGSGTAGTWTYTPGTVPTITLNNYEGDGIQLYDPTPENGFKSVVYLRIYVNGNCTITSAGTGIELLTNADFNAAQNGVQSNLSIFLNGDNTSLTINAKYGIRNTAFSPRTYIECPTAYDNCKVSVGSISTSSTTASDLSLWMS